VAERLDHVWRVFATGLCFVAFGVGGVAVRLIVFPLLRLVLRDPRHRTLVSRSLIQTSFRGFVGMMCALGVISLEVHGHQRLQRRGLLILANHPSLIDVVLLIAFVDRADCVVKAALARNPFTRGPVHAAGYVCNDSGAGLIDDCIRSVRGGDNLIIFPEGTRTPGDGALRLQRGAANVAVRGALDITPVHIRVTPPALAKGVRWYQVPRQRAHFVVRIDDDIPIAGFAATPGNEAMAVRRLTDHMTQYFSREPARAAA